MAEGISAGTVYADVVPDLSKFGARARRQTSTEAQSLGRHVAERMAGPLITGIARSVRSGFAKAGAGAEAAGVKHARAYMRAFRAAVQASRPVKIPVTVDDKAIDRVFARIRRKARASGEAAGDQFTDGFGKTGGKSRSKPPGPTRRQSTKAGEESGGGFADGFRKQVAAAAKSLPPVQVGVARSEAEQAMKDLYADLQALANKRIGVDIDTDDAIQEAARLEAKLSDLGRSSPSVQVRADTAAAAVSLSKISAQVKALNADRVEVDVDVDDSRVTRTLNKIAGVITQRFGESAGRAFGQVAGFIRDSLESAAQAAVSFGTRAAASLGLAATEGTALTVSTGGLNIALGILAVVMIAAVSAVAALASGMVILAPLLLTVGGLLGAVTTAVVGAGAAVAVLGFGLSGIGDALGAMGEAEKSAGRSATQSASQQASLASAMDGVLNAQRQLAKAREQAAEGARQAAQRVEDAERDLISAQRNALRAQEDLTQARREAREALEDLDSAVRGNALDQQQALYDVRDAKAELDAVLEDPQATQRQRDEARIAYEQQVLQQEDLRRRGERLQAEQATAVKAGVEGSEQVRSAQERIAQANEQVADAERRVAEARRAQAQQARDGADQIVQAQEAVAAAQRAAQTATVSAGEAGSAAMDKLNDAMEGLSPNARKLVRELYRLKGPFGELKKFVQDRLLEGFAEQVRVLAGRWLPALRPILGRVADSFNELGDQLFESLGRRDFIANIGVAVDGVGNMIDRISLSIPGVVDAFGRLAASSTPVLEKIGDLIGRVLDKFSAWIKSADESGALDQFMRDAADALEDIFDIGSEVVGIIGELIETFFPQSQDTSKTFLEQVRDSLAGIRKWLDDPENKEKLRGFIDDVREFVSGIDDFVAKVRDEWIPAIQGWIDRVAGWINTVQVWVDRVRMFASILATPFVSAQMAASTALGLITQAFSGAANAWLIIWQIIRDLVLTPLRTFFSRTLPSAFASGASAITTRFSGLYDSLSSIAASIRTNVFGRLISIVTETIPQAFAASATAVGVAWNRVRELTKEPVRFIIDTVMNRGILNAYNTIAKVFGVKPYDVQVPLRGFASGGYVRGPGSGTSDSVPARLSNGEYVIPARVVRQHGVRFFDDLIGRRGIGARRPGDGSEGLAFAAGGLVDLGDVWEAVVNPADRIKPKLDALIAAIPGAGPFNAAITGLGSRLVDGLLHWISGAGGTGTLSMVGDLGKAQAFVRDQAGKPYVWAGVGPGGYDCSGMVGAAYRVAHGQSPHQRIFSTSTMARFFPKVGKRGAFTAGWSHAGERGGGSVGHTAAEIGGLKFEARGGDGVVVGSRATPYTAFARFGTYDSGGYLPPGLTLAYNGTGRPEPILTDRQWTAMIAATRGGDGPREEHHYHGVSQQITPAWVQRQNDLRAAMARAGRPNH